MNLLSLAETDILSDRGPSQWIDIVFLLFLALVLIGALFWLLPKIRITHDQQAAAISLNTEVLQVAKVQIEVLCETNRLLSELNETVRKKADGP